MYAFWKPEGTTQKKLVEVRPKVKVLVSVLRCSHAIACQLGSISLARMEIHSHTSSPTPPTQLLVSPNPVGGKSCLSAQARDSAALYLLGRFASPFSRHYGTGPNVSLSVWQEQDEDSIIKSRLEGAALARAPSESQDVSVLRDKESHYTAHDKKAMEWCIVLCEAQILQRSLQST